MSRLILLRHSLTEGNERRLYYGWTDIPLSPAGRALCLEMRESRPLPACGLCVTSGLIRANETLALLTGREPDEILPDLREMRFGRFEMRGYEELRDDPDYRRWVSGGPCPGGESQAEFRARILRGGAALLGLGGGALAICHGGVIANLMEAWFPAEGRDFYEWQPGPCRGYRIEAQGETPARFFEI